MENRSKIINSDIVNNEANLFWNELPPGISNSGVVKLLIISVHFENDSSEHTQFKKIIQACQLVESEIYLIHLNEPLSWHKIKNILNPKVVLLLGISPIQLGISAQFKFFQPNNFDDCIWLVTYSLFEMEKETDAKKQLWQYGLKPVFIDKTIGNI